MTRRRVDCAGLFGLGLPEVAVIAGIAALVFGPQAIASKLPGLGKELGQTVKSFNTAAKDFQTELKEASAPDEEDPAKQGEAKAVAPAPPAPEGEKKKSE